MRRGSGVPGGFYFGPTVAAGLTPKSELAQEEVFGPVLTVLPFDTLSEAIAIANGTRYGLGAAIWSRDVATVLEAANRLVAGTVFANSFWRTSGSHVRSRRSLRAPGSAPR